MAMAVDLPQPDGPTTVTNSPSAMASEKRSSAVKRDPSGAAKSRDTASKAILGATLGAISGALTRAPARR